MQTSDVCVFLCLSVCTVVQSVLRRVTCVCCCSVSNVAGQARWCRSVWRVSAHWWSRHLKPAPHLSIQLSVFFSLHLLCSLFNIFSGLSPYSLSLSLSYLHLQGFFFCLPLSLHFLLSPFISYGISFSLCVCICLSLAGFLVYHSSQEAVVWDIPVSTVI